MLHSIILMPSHGLMLDLCTACTPKQTQSHLSPGSPTDFGCLMSLYLDSDDLPLCADNKYDSILMKGKRRCGLRVNALLGMG